MGKFGGRDLSYGADLDVLFVGDEERTAQRLLSTMAQPSAEGNLPRIDARLRPEGEKGPLVCSLESYNRYYSGRAQLWEVQALTRARPVAGPSQKDFVDTAQSAWRTAGHDADLFRKIDNMLERIRRERGTGGTIEAEFLVQALQMRAEIWEPNWSRAVDRLRDAGCFTDSEVVDLKRSYGFLRHCESVVRRFENKPVAVLPGEETEQLKFVRHIGFESIETFTKQYDEARSLVHDVYERRLRGG
jgi:glutamate-ammonia-ligase adenylyltransferase